MLSVHDDLFPLFGILCSLRKLVIPGSVLTGEVRASLGACEAGSRHHRCTFYAVFAGHKEKRHKKCSHHCAWAFCSRPRIFFFFFLTTPLAPRQFWTFIAQWSSSSFGVLCRPRSLKKISPHPSIYLSSACNDIYSTAISLTHPDPHVPDRRASQYYLGVVDFLSVKTEFL